MYYQHYNGNFSEGIGRGIRNSFRQGSVLTRLIYVNCGIFLLLKILHVLFLLGGQGEGFYTRLLEWTGMPADATHLPGRPWGPFTYMFVHFDFLHLLFNMLWLYWFGSLFQERYSGRRLTILYLLGGLAGGLAYMAAYNIFPYFEGMRQQSWAIGASASVMAVVFALATSMPGYKVYIFLIGPVSLIGLAGFTALIDLLSIPAGNPGGHIAHLGGALAGCLFSLTVTGKSLPSLSILKGIFRKKKGPRLRFEGEGRGMDSRKTHDAKKEKEDAINTILDKISRSGYESLTREEKAMLFKSRNE